MKRKFRVFIVGILSMLVCLGLLAGCSKDKTFHKQDMHITLTSDFYEKDYISLTAYYESRNALVTVLKEDVSTLPGAEDYTLSEYSDMVLSANNLSSAEVYDREGKEYQYFTYQKSVSGQSFFYLATTHKANDAFWLIQFACTASNKDKYMEKFLGWADTITFGYLGD